MKSLLTATVITNMLGGVALAQPYHLPSYQAGERDARIVDEAYRERDRRRQVQPPPPHTAITRSVSSSSGSGSGHLPGMPCGRYSVTVPAKPYGGGNRGKP